jgi:hypothetical protein
MVKESNFACVYFLLLAFMCLYLNGQPNPPPRARVVRASHAGRLHLPPFLYNKRSVRQSEHILYYWMWKGASWGTQERF